MRMIALVSLMTFCATPVLADTCQAPLPQNGQAFSGVVGRVIAGDSLCVVGPNGGIKVRLSDFNAKDKGTAGGQPAKETLYDLAHGKPVTCMAGKKSYERVIAHCTVGGKSLGDAMRQQGVPEGGKM